MVWALQRIEKEKPAAGKTDYWRDFWRSGWDSNPRNLAVQLISSQSRYDHFDTAPYLSQHQHLGKRGELMGRTSKNIKLRIPEKPHKIKGFRSGSYRVATTISSAAPSTTRTTLRVYFRPVFFPEICSKIRWRENRRDGKKYSILRFSVLRNIKENQGDEIPSFRRNFESAPFDHFDTTARWGIIPHFLPLCNTLTGNCSTKMVCKGFAGGFLLTFSCFSGKIKQYGAIGKFSDTAR